MENRDERQRNLNFAAADGGDLLTSQAQLWIDMGAALAGLLARMRRGSRPAAEDGETTDGEADRRSSEQEAA